MRRASAWKGEKAMTDRQMSLVMQLMGMVVDKSDTIEEAKEMIGMIIEIATPAGTVIKKPPEK